jgi:putative inorganic carbon (hco3(-)) transporter
VGGDYHQHADRRDGISAEVLHLIGHLFFSQRAFGPFALLVPAMSTASRPNNPVALAVASYLLAVPLLLTLVGSDLSSYDAARVAQLVVMPLIAALGVRTAMPRPPIRLRWAALALAVLGLLSCVLSANPWMALREFLNLACLGAVGFVLAAQRDDALELLPRAAALAVMAYAVPTLGMAVVGALHGLPLGADLPLPGFANRRYLNHVQTVALPLAACGVLLFRSPALRLLTGLGLLVSMVLLWITLGRGSLLGFALASAVLAALWWRGRREVRPLALVFGVCLLLAGPLAAALQALVAPLAQASGMGRTAVALELASDHSRFSLWWKAWDMLVQSPLLGAGPMHYAYGNHEKAAHPHSLPLQLLAEWGLPATLLVGLLCAWLVIALVRRLRTAAGADAQLGAGLLATWAAVLVDSWFSGLWVMPVSQMWLAALLGLSWAWLLQGELPAPTATRRWNLTPLLLSSALLLHTLPELVELRSHLALVKQAFPGEGARPRFWSQGHFGAPQRDAPP